MVREPNKVPPRWQPRHLPPGSESFANLLRDPAVVIAEVVARELVARGHTDVSPALLSVGTHIGRGGSRITELAERTQLTKATVVRSVDELERLGYVERTPDPEDRRAKRVRATARGLAVERDGREIIAELRSEWAKAMDAGDLDRLEALLQKLRLTLWPAKQSER